jgi:predicted CoA-binding protein
MPNLGYDFPADTDKHTDSEIKNFYKLKNIAVVGMSTNETKPAHFVPKYLIEHGFNVVPVNPTASEILGRKSYPRITDIPQHIDIVDVFRKSEDVPALVDNAIMKRG